MSRTRKLLAVTTFALSALAGQAAVAQASNPPPYGDEPAATTTNPGRADRGAAAVRRAQNGELNREGRLVPQPERDVTGGNVVHRGTRAERRAARAERRANASASNKGHGRAQRMNPEKGAD